MDCTQMILHRGMLELAVTVYASHKDFKKRVPIKRSSLKDKLLQVFKHISF